MAQRSHEVAFRSGVGWVMQFAGATDVILLTHCPYCGGGLPQLRFPNTNEGWLRLLRTIYGDDGEGAE